MTEVEIPSHWRGRARLLRGPAGGDEWFTKEELEQLAAFRLPKRREEWRLSRIAGKQLLREKGSLPYLSYSHSAPYGAAAADRQPVGVDVQVLRAVPEGAAHFFLDEQQIEEMQSCSIASRLIHFWCAKEAAWKRAGGSILTLRRVPLHLEEATPRGLRFRQGVETYAIEDAVMALTLPTS